LKHHHTKHAKEKLGLLLGLCGIGIFAMNFFGVSGFDTTFALVVAGLLFASFLGLLVSALGISVLTAVTALEVISLLGNVLSYCRLMALGLAAVLIADLANKLVDGLGLFIGLPLAIAVHLFNIALAIFSPTLHSLRLNYVEFLPKFYKPEGKSYKPFKKEASW
jgi:V/A-type H+-transporting ATPase subunit I